MLFVACRTQFNQVGLVILGCFYDGPMCSPDVTHDKGGAKKNSLIKDTSHKTHGSSEAKGRISNIGELLG